jgi:hypothetical protein
MNLGAVIYQGRGADERSTRKQRPPAKIANRLRPHSVRWHKIDAVRSAELRAEGIMKGGEEIRVVVNRMHDGQPLAKAFWKTPGLAMTLCAIRSGIRPRPG